MYDNMESLIIPTKGDFDSECDSSGEMNERGKKRKISLTRCGMCDTEEARYRCPGCMTHSCSLVCVKKHKVETGCSGVRDKAAFVPLSEFDEINLLNDYRFLEETGRLADSATRDVFTQLPQQTQRVQKLAKQANAAKIHLKVLPRTFTKRKENSTFYHRREGRFYWHLKLVFPQSSAEYAEKRVPDNQTLEEILKSYIHPTESDPVRRQKLKIYAQSPVDHVRVFMKAEENRPNSLRYHELDVKKSLKDNLMHKTIIEYPALHVTLKDHCQDYLTQRQGEVWTPRVTTTTPPESLASGPEADAETEQPKVDPHSPRGTLSVTPLAKKVKRAPLSEEELEDGEILSGNEGEEEDEDCKGKPVDGTGSEIPGANNDNKQDESEDDDGSCQEDKTDSHHKEEMSGNVSSDEA
ncbi:box C/D snoRNA protein 1 [Sardina pilchardus]|uniref:box C/D snoRNA protein 1 n=1 Tax=Sardina pilchardus TaxID=27697 RepID=UPI002E0DD4E7